MRRFTPSKAKVVADRLNAKTKDKWQYIVVNEERHSYIAVYCDGKFRQDF